MKIGTIGTNFIVTNFIEAARKTGKAEIAACYSRDAETAAAFAKKHGIPKTYSDRDAFLREKDLDFIYVASPNSLHYEWTRDALLAGRNVICEKPFVSTVAELQDLLKISKEQGLFLFEALTIPHLPNFKLIQQHLPEIGQVRLVQLNFSQYSSRYDAFLRGENPNLFNPQFSGGALMDLGYYNLAFIVRLFGEPDTIEYLANKAQNGIDTSGVLVLRYPERNRHPSGAQRSVPGFICTAVATKDSNSRNFVQIQGESGYIASESTSSSLRGGISVITKAGETRYNEQDDENVLYYEMLDFTRDFEAGDRSCCDAPLELCRKTISLTERVRKGAGIFFGADKTDK
jgi:predicted dehydrogenase